ncbi:MAG: hypothetical protein QM496_05700 [Verrucomicrobiota bacterium]
MFDTLFDYADSEIKLFLLGGLIAVITLFVVEKVISTFKILVNGDDDYLQEQMEDWDLHGMNESAHPNQYVENGVEYSYNDDGDLLSAEPQTFYDASGNEMTAEENEAAYQEFLRDSHPDDADWS